MNCIQGSGSPLVVTHKRREKIKISTANNNETACVTVTPENSAVFVRDLCKGYGNGPPVIKNLSMNVRKGTIYGLLGASGCGKTSLLTCMVGLQKWESGEVLVFGKRPGTKESGIPGKRLGYMPQDISLYNTLTIPEMVSFYGKIYNMPSSEVEHTMQFLIKLLQLPPKKQMIGDLSGGQKRRASLALALVHCPELLILDEPTVGLDPLLRKSIWNHLYKIVTTLHTTIIITTHYIEEARLSDTIGFMRNGRLLVEDTPTVLLNTFKCELLEDVVLKLCRADESNIKKLSNNQANSEGNKVVFKANWKQDVSGVVNQDEMNGIFRKAVGFDCEISENLKRRELTRRSSSILLRLRTNPLYHSFQKIQGFSTVMWLQFLRYPLFAAILILLPTIQGTITLGTIGTKPHGMDVGIVNNELLNWTSGCEEYIFDENTCDLTYLSCKYIHQIKKDDLLDVFQYNSEDEAKAGVHHGDLWGYLVFPTNYTQHTLDLVTAGRFAENETLEGSRIHMHLDMSQYIGSFFMIKNTFDAYGEYVKQLAVSCQIGQNRTDMPIYFRKPVYGTNEDGYTEFLIPGSIMNNMLTLLSVLTSIIYIVDRRQGTLSRARVAGLGTIDILVSHMLTQGSVALAQIVLWTITCYLTHGFVVLGPAWLYLLICLLTGFCGAALGILQGILCSDEIEAVIIGIFISPLLFFFGGVFWPLEGMSKFWQSVAAFLPTTLPIISLRSVIVRGLGITHPFVWPGVVVIVIWTLGLSICVIIAFTRSTK
ncbi:unnamed protein product [Orchesella dallaii]|uniref:ABC transporter domain-containing protein n=1 Tax=Orchesella dallaii TaxID=48710 RepID=A0ABP1R937_9HEXA